MLIEEQKLAHWIRDFYGFGSYNAPVWFIGYEEGGGDLPEEVAERLDYFFNLGPGDNQSLCDLRELYKNVVFRAEGQRTKLFKTLYDYRFGDQAVLHGVWKNLIAFSHGYRGIKLPDLVTYQKELFTLTNEALIQLYPLPSPHNHAWYYSWLDLPQKSFLTTRKTYEEHLYPQRIQTLLEKVSQYKPEVVLMFSMNNINALKRSLQNYFDRVEFRMVKGIKLQTPQYHRADISQTTFIITTQTPALKHNRIETGFDWERLGREVR